MNDKQRYLFDTGERPVKIKADVLTVKIWLPDFAGRTSVVPRGSEEHNDSEMCLKVEGVHPVVTKEDITSLFEMFGKLKYVHLVDHRSKKPGFLHAPWSQKCVLQFDDPQTAHTRGCLALNMLQNFELATRRIVIRWINGP
ncbi:hypothetical protein sscle_11g086540 [Sclerotinia sclerotiorum 1980 UF-70]|nr:hypothetical protein sscle_11g086540 [Sclerotinia sclerotiorum 1980 UF-70]